MIEVRKSVFDGEASGMSVISATNTARGRAFFVRLFVVNSLTLTLSPMQPLSIFSLTDLCQFVTVTPHGSMPKKLSQALKPLNNANPNYHCSHQYRQHRQFLTFDVE